VAVHTYLCRTRWGDIDCFGHVNNVRYVQYVQESVVDLLYQGRMPGSGPLFAQGFLIVHHDIDYRAQLRHRDVPVPISVWITRIGRSSFDVATELRRDGETVLTARTVVVARDGETGRSRPLSPAEAAFLREHQIQPVRAVEPSHRGPVHRATLTGLHRSTPCRCRENVT
jgi:acyl-CoA thioester hydrolase